MGSQKAKKKVAYKIKFGDCETPQHHTFEAEEHRPVAETHLFFIFYFFYATYKMDWIISLQTDAGF